MLGTLSTSVIMQASKAARRAPLLISLWTHAFAFRNPGELLFGASLLYFYRLFERQWGSAKYGSFLVVTCGLAYALEAAVGAALGGGLRPAGTAASGPFPLLFANLAANFVLLVPPMHQFAVFGFKMTDKVSSRVTCGQQPARELAPTDAWPTDGLAMAAYGSIGIAHPKLSSSAASPVPPSLLLQAFIYLASIQLLLSAPPKSVVAGLCGLAAGQAYRLNLLGMQRLRLPAAVVDLFSSTIGRLLVGPGPPQQVFVTPIAAQQQQQFGGRQQQQQGTMTQRGGGGGGAAAAVARPTEPSPEAVQQLVAMGFDQGSAAQALRQTGNNVEAALQYLL
jgi:hypothetical protein